MVSVGDGNQSYRAANILDTRATFYIAFGHIQQPLLPSRSLWLQDIYRIYNNSMTIIIIRAWEGVSLPKHGNKCTGVDLTHSLTSALQSWQLGRNVSLEINYT